MTHSFEYLQLTHFFEGGFRANSLANLQAYKQTLEMWQISQVDLFHIHLAQAPLPSFITGPGKLNYSISWLVYAAWVARQCCLCQKCIDGSS